MYKMFYLVKKVLKSYLNFFLNNSWQLNWHLSISKIIIEISFYKKTSETQSNSE